MSLRVSCSVEQVASLLGTRQSGNLHRVVVETARKVQRATGLGADGSAPSAPQRRSRRIFYPSLIAGVVAFLAVVAAGRRTAAQMGDRTAPTKTYHASFGEFYDGEYRNALDRFRSEARGAIKTVNARWVDSICYETMIGECYYQMGDNAQACDHYTAALNLFLANSTWFSQVRIEQIRQDSGVVKRTPWQSRNLLAPIGRLPFTMVVAQGQLQPPGQPLQAGVVQPPQLFPLEPCEIIRCTCLALRRRAELLGPLAAHDQVFDNVIAALQRPAGRPNHWSEAWLNVELGAALAAGGRNAAAQSALQKGLLASGELEHQLTGIAHLELGRLSMAAGDYAAAAQHFDEATYDAYFFSDVLHVPDLGLMEEAFHYGALNHLLSNGKGVFAPLAPAAAWAKANRFRQLYVSLTCMTAEGNLISAQTQQAESLLEEARSAMGSRTMVYSRLSAWRTYLQATALYQARKTADGDAALAKVIPFLRSSSIRLFQILKVDENYTGGGKAVIGAAREAVDLYKDVLCDPRPIDWMTDPMETLATLCVPHELPFEHWFTAAIARKDHELAMEVADRARRHRFFSTLSMGGRLEALRWVLEAPKELLPPQAMLQRQDLMVRYPSYKDLHDQSEAVRRELAALPLASDNAETVRKQGQLMARLQSVGQKQENVLREIALRREPAAMAFPPLRATADIQKSLPPGHALLVFFATSDNLYAFLLNREKYANWQVAATPQAILKKATTVLRDLGNASPGYELAAKDLDDPRWRKDAADLLDSLLKGTREVDLSKKFQELTIVPDGPLWYVPFEALQVRVDKEPQPLISRFRVRYAPTAGLATAYQEIGHRRGNTVIVSGKYYSKLDDEVVAAAVTDLSKSLPGCVTVKLPLPAPAPIYASSIDRLVVLDDLGGATELDPYGWSPLPAERKNSGTLSDWFSLPCRGPDEMVLPGFHSASEAALKQVTTLRRTSKPEGSSARASARGASKSDARLGDVGAVSPGDEIFLSLCGLMSTGTRTVLLSRWRSGGQASLDLVREFTQELPHTTPADAWQRAVQVVSNGPLAIENEPRVKKTASPTSASPALKAAHPFFWAGYMLVDGGSPAESK